MKLTLVKCEGMDDWYTIERAEHDGREWLESTGPNTKSFMRSARISDACVEGYSSEMLALAEAIEKRECESFKRCAVDATSDRVEFWSPRNSQRPGIASWAEADELAALIRTTLAPVPLAGTASEVKP